MFGGITIKGIYGFGKVGLIHDWILEGLVWELSITCILNVYKLDRFDCIVIFLQISDVGNFWKLYDAMLEKKKLSGNK